ncbi:hypothetical protein ACKWTF_011053 [Chironomus riparius]
MVVFEEYFPSEKEIIQKYAERQRKLEEVSMTLRKSEISSNDSPKLLIPRKSSISMILSEIHRDTEDKLKQSSDVDAKIEKIHKMIENVDSINFIMEPNKEAAILDGSGDVNEVAGSIINETAASTSHELDENSSISDLSPKRVIRLKHNDSSLELPDYKPPQIKPTKASILKSKFNSEKSQKNPATISRSFKSRSVAEPLPKTPRAVSFAKFEPPKRIESKKASQSVRKILDDAKEKHKAKNSVKSNVPVNVLDLFLI